ncbi:non-structural maintenance of chromosomes element 3 homolog [Achroia grisella]|uniref:non-structural maintenance of chromosomes element 3 homolog n=1 Tax=Achroia grisella TaxID=688607 RepID=UPI0027D1EAEA|nr:non-structural maintenance of chromosomes element 3 homolog [Achroia grisella]XP_059054886.1 non-structural maintenance of chromosomes element 3 homolog [Achroia grisella]
MSQRRQNISMETEENLGGAINECVRYIVIREGSKIPIKRAEIAKHLNSTCQTPSNQVNSVVIEANKILKKVYGYKLIQVESKSGIQYIVVLNEESDLEPSCVSNPHHRRMLIAALTHIYMTGGPVKEDEMWKFLSEAGLMEEDDHTARKVLTNTLTRQLYLQFSKVGEGELARNVFEWGQRAMEEVPKMFLLNKMAEAFGKDPNHWHEQYKEATEETNS